MIHCNKFSPLASLILGALLFNVFVERPPCLAQIYLSDVSHQSGINFQHYAGQTGKNYIIETITSGLASIDFDNDGLLDIYLPSGTALPGSTKKESPTNRLFRNLGNFKFQDVTISSGAGDLGFAMGVASADIDNDGNQDLIVTNFGQNVILQNRGDGSFKRIVLPNIKDYKRVCAGVSLFDADSDGNLDIYISNYVKFDYRDISRSLFGVPLAPGPKDFEPDSDTLLRNMGNETFTDISVSSGIAAVSGQGMGLVAFDFDSDGDVDVFVCNDSASNYLFENQGNLRFDEIALLAGLAHDVTGSRQASMGVDVGDVNRDGLLDLVTTNFSGEVPTVYINSGQGFFDDVGPKLGLGILEPFVSWGLGLADFDNDGYLDLFVACGYLIESLESANTINQFAMPNFLFKNKQGKSFENISNQSPAVQERRVSRGACVDDFDNDGAIDVVTLNLNDQPQVLRNQSSEIGNFLTVRLVGIASNRDAIGAVVKASTGELIQVQTCVAGRGYQSDFGRRLHFGLGNNNAIDKLEIKWPSGQSQLLKNITGNQFILIREGDDKIIQLTSLNTPSNLARQR